MSHTKTLRAQVRDVSAYERPGKRLEIYFEKRDGSWLPGHDETIILELRSESYKASVGQKPPNRPYLHSPLDDGRTNCTEALKNIGCDHGDAILFDLVSSPRSLRLTHILKGEGPPPRQGPRNRVRATSSPKSEPRRQSTGPMPRKTLEQLSIVTWSERYWDLITEPERTEEQSFGQLLDEARKVGHLEKPLFIRLGRWKSPRIQHRLETNLAERIRAVTHDAFAAKGIIGPVQHMRKLNGVATRTGTAMLHWMRPTEFPILDFRVVAALGWDTPDDWEDLSFYASFAEHVIDLAGSLSVDLRTIDRALWAMDKAN